MQKQLQVERYLKIFNTIKKQQTVKIEELSELLGISMNTVRRDLTNLEKQGLLRRTHGGAILVDAEKMALSYETRSQEGSSGKEAIGKRAARLVKPGSTIIVDAGTTTLQLARNLMGMTDLTVLTNSLEIAQEIGDNPQIVVIVSGGIYQKTSQHLIGLPAEQFFSQIHADQLFFSATAISCDKGMLASNLHSIPIKRKMIEVAKEIIILADSTKFEKGGMSVIAPLTVAQKIVTDWGAPEPVIAKLQALGLDVIIANQTEER